MVCFYVASTIVMDIHFDEFLVNCQAVFCHFVKNFGKYARKIGNIFQSGHSNNVINYAMLYTM